MVSACVVARQADTLDMVVKSRFKRDGVCLRCYKASRHARLLGYIISMYMVTIHE